MVMSGEGCSAEKVFSDGGTKGFDVWVKANGLLAN